MAAVAAAVASRGAALDEMKPAALMLIVHEAVHAPAPAVATAGAPADGGGSGDAGAAAAPAFAHTDAVFVRVRELWAASVEDDAAAAAPGEAAAAGAPGDGEGGDDDEEPSGVPPGADPGSDSDADAARPPRPTRGAAGGGSGRRVRGDAKRSMWRSRLSEVLRYDAGRAKLERERPNTAAFGNWGVLGAVRALAEAGTGVRVTTRLLAGRKARNL